MQRRVGQALSLSLDNEHRETSYAPPDYALMLRTTVHL